MNAPTETDRKLTTQVEAVIYFFKKMDYEMIGDLLLDDRTYQEMEKREFVRKLSYLFDNFSGLGDHKLFCANRVEGMFNEVDVIAITFIGCSSHNFVDILFEIDKRGMILDMYEFEDPESDRDLWFQEGRLFIDNYEIYEDDDYEDEYYDDDLDFPLN